jgi:hypothetical protein
MRSQCCTAAALQLYACTLARHHNGSHQHHHITHSRSASSIKLSEGVCFCHGSTGDSLIIKSSHNAGSTS